MPQNTPNRGYTYPLYTEPTMNFPGAIQELATDINNDMNAVQAAITGARNRPSAMIFNNLVQSIPNNTATNVSWVGSSTNYDNDTMATTTGLTLTDRGVYMLSASVFMAAPGAGGVFGASITIASSAGFIPQPVRMSSRASATQPQWLSASALHYVTGLVADSITVQVWHNQGAALGIQYRTLMATKVSNTIGGV